MTKSEQQLTSPGGNQLRFLPRAADTGGQWLEVEATYQSHSEEPPARYHPYQDEHPVVVSGRMHTVIEGREQVLEAGEALSVPVGAVHSMHNAGDEPARVLWQTRPALNTKTFFETVWG